MRQALRCRILAAKGEEHFERRVAQLIEELEAERLLAIRVAGLAHGEHGSQRRVADVHIQRLRLHIEEISCFAELAELANIL